jgi:hypothetical protein
MLPTRSCAVATDESVVVTCSKGVFAAQKELEECIRE